MALQQLLLIISEIKKGHNVKENQIALEKLEPAIIAHQQRSSAKIKEYQRRIVSS